MSFKSCIFSKFVLKNFHRHILRKTHSEVDSIINSTTGIKPKIKKDPFMKNVFLGIVDKDILCFPEVEITEEYNVQIGTQLQIGTKAIAKEEESFTKLLRSGICRLGFPEIYGGYHSTSTRLLKEIEKLEISPTISFFIETQYSHIIENIVIHGSELQKKKYLSDLMSGTIIGAYAVHEEGSADPSSLQCVATPNDFSETTSYTLNGEKTWIINASRAKLFIVLAQAQDANRPIVPGILSAFIVDRDTPGITVSKQTILTNEYDICQVKLDQVVVPQESVLGNIGDGYEIAVSSLESNKFIFALSILNLIRKLSSHATIQTCQINSFPLPLRDYEFIQYRLSKIITTLYALESSIYLLAGMKDNYEMDTALESVIFQNLIYSYGFNAIEDCINLSGKGALSDVGTTKSIIDNLLILSQSFVSPEMLKFYISLKALEYAGASLADTVIKSRNPLNYPGFIFKRLWNLRGQSMDSPKLNKNLYMELHPSLKINADQLEYCVCRLHYGLDKLLTVHGTEAVQRQIDLVRLADVASDIFAMFAILARASRSYCTGMQYCDQELLVANAWCQDAMKRVKVNVSEIVDGKVNLSDYTFLKLAPDIIQHKGYFFVSPTEKNIH